MLLGDVSKIKTGNLDVNAKVENGRYPFFTCARRLEKIDSYSFDCECVLVAGNGDLNVKYYEGKFDVYQRTYVIEVLRRDRLDTRFLFYFLNKYLEKLRSQSIGGVIKYIKMANLTDIKLPNYSLEKQKQIVETLDTADSLRQKRKEQLALLDDYLKSVFLDMFGDPVINEKGWKVLELGALICHLTSGGRGWSKHYSTKGARFIRSLDVQMNSISDKEMIYVVPPKNREAERTRIKTRDVLLTITGSRIGRVAVIPDNINEAYVSQHVAIIRVKNINQLFLSYYLSMPESGQKIIRRNQYGQTKPGLSLEQIKRFPIIVPPTNLQNKFASIVEQTEQTKQKMRASLDEMDNHFNALMQRYFG